jgi:hypothetical protein
VCDDLDFDSLLVEERRGEEAALLHRPDGAAKKTVASGRRMFFVRAAGELSSIHSSSR